MAVGRAKGFIGDSIRVGSDENDLRFVLFYSDMIYTAFQLFEKLIVEFDGMVVLDDILILFFYVWCFCFVICFFVLFL
jgi:hypothetical protein